jgi:hypothetical protein
MLGDGRGLRRRRERIGRAVDGYSRPVRGRRSLRNDGGGVDVGLGGLLVRRRGRRNDRLIVSDECGLRRRRERIGRAVDGYSRPVRSRRSSLRNDGEGVDIGLGGRFVRRRGRCNDRLIVSDGGGLEDDRGDRGRCRLIVSDELRLDDDRGERGRCRLIVSDKGGLNDHRGGGGR